MADEIGNRAAQAAGTVTDKLRTGMDAASGLAKDTMEFASATVNDAAMAAPEKARQVIGDNAALIGGLGIAIGAIIAASLPTTRAEASVLGSRQPTASSAPRAMQPNPVLKRPRTLWCR